MKLADVKERIDKFFRETSSEEIYDLALSCGFEQVDDEYEELENVSFDNNKVTKYIYVPPFKVHSSNGKANYLESA